MSHQLAFINGATLKALRARRKVSPEFLCRKAGVSLKQLAMWEQCSDSDFPTMGQAEKMAKALLVPLAGLYLKPQNLPEEKIPPLVNKRRVQDACLLDDSALHLAVCKLAQIRADSIEIAAEADVVLRKSAMPVLEGDYASAAATIREWIGLSLEDQKRTSNGRQNYLALRARLEERGVLVAQFDGVEVEELRGLALYYDELPVIGVNATDHWPAKCFSVLHELVHLSKRSSTYCNLIGVEADDREEVFCNYVAGEFLFPRYCAVAEVAAGLDPRDISSIESVARKYSVSRDVVARRFRDCGYLDKGVYEELLDVFSRKIAEEREERRKKRERGDKAVFVMPREKAVVDSFGSLYCGLVAQGLSTGLFNERDACSAFGVERDKLGKVFKEALA